MAKHHQMEAWLYDNILSSDDPNDLVARVSRGVEVGVSDISRRAASRKKYSFSEDSITNAVEIWLREMANCLCDGLSVNVGGWFTASAAIKGSFAAPTEKFLPEKHTLWVELRQGALLRRKLESTTVKIRGRAASLPEVDRVIDVKSNSVNDLVTPGNLLRICGTGLRITNGDPANGVWFVGRGTGKRIRIADSDVLFNKPGELIVMVPRLRPGAYTVEITTRAASADGTPAERRTAAFDRPLTVQKQIAKPTPYII